MPISQEKHINILKAGAYYRMAYQKLLAQLKGDWERAHYNEIPMRLDNYISELLLTVQSTDDKLNPTYGQYIEAGLQYYTPAKVKENERIKQWHQRKREVENPNRKQRQQSNKLIIDGLPAFDISQYESNVYEPPPSINMEELDRINQAIDDNAQKRREQGNE